MNKYTDDIGIDVTQYQLRHNYALMLYNACIGVKTVQNLFGHANVNITFNIHTYIEKSVPKNKFKIEQIHPQKGIKFTAFLLQVSSKILQFNQII